MPRAWRSSPWRGSASWLLAAPATIFARMRGMVVVVERRAERARREHVALDLEDLVERHDRRAELALRALGLERIDVGDGELGARRVELLAEVVADVADALHRDVHALERRRARAASFTQASMPRRTPSAVNGDGSPEPPCVDVDAGDVLGHACG